MAKLPWRFQGDVAYGESDPTVTIFMGNLKTDEETGAVSVEQDTSNPITMPLSKFAKMAKDGIAVDELDAVATREREKRIAAREEAKRVAAEAAAAAKDGE